MKQQMAYIGTTEVVSLPDYGITDILAKVDTGADSSAIWATNIAEVDGELRFTLFGPSSPHYTNQEIKTRKYSTVTVKNSFGHSEVRYKVSLKLQMADRVIRANITLANRANNRYPILIGRKTLKGKFLVDVSKKSLGHNSNRILMLVYKRSDNIENFAGYIDNKEIDFDISTYGELVFETGGEGNKITISGTDDDVAHYGLTYFNTSRVKGHHYVSASIALYLYNRNLDFIDRSVLSCPEPPKLYQYILFSDNHIPVPKSLFMLPQKMQSEYERLVATLGSPFILKDNRGRRGDYNYLINNKEEFDRSMLQAMDNDVWLIAQKFIPNHCDYRFLILGSQVALVIKRTRKGDHTHLNNVSAGADSEIVPIEDFPSEAINNAVAAARLLQQQVAGVDIIQDKETKLWYCLEVNSAPQIYSGAYVEPKQEALAKYLVQRLSN
jgi:glutathione synthase/RimK-type ligase-like ATP-grasp enzyme